MGVSRFEPISSFSLEKEHGGYGVDFLDQVFTEQETALHEVWAGTNLSMWVGSIFLVEQ